MTELSGVLTIKERKALDTFKDRVKDLLRREHDEHYLRKWLKARSFDVSKSEQMFRNSMAYREKMKVDKILQEYTPPEVLQKYLAGGFAGFDKDGSPIRVELFGHLDMKGIMYSSKKSDLEKTKLLLCEQTVVHWRQQSKKLGRKIDGLTVIFDMENVGTQSLWRPGLQMYLSLVKVLEDIYPEMMKRMFVINAPRIFPLLWKICRPLVSDDTKTKIRKLGSDYTTVLLKYIDADQLPQFLGGTLTDSDGNPRCTSRICQGGKVPSSYYLSETIESEDMETALVAKGEKLKIDIQVDKVGSILRWEFRSEHCDIAFGVVYVDGQREEEVVPVKRYNCHQVAHDDSIACERPGLYVAVFDNSYSWVNSKTVRFLIELHTNDVTSDLEMDQVSSNGSWTRLVQGGHVTHL